jgi:hypothetical protein
VVDLKKEFDKYIDMRGNRFETIKEPLHRRPDMCAFLLLDRLVPTDGDMVGAAEHDQIWLNVDCEKLAEVATEEDIRMLDACGVFLDEDTDSLSMFA